MNRVSIPSFNQCAIANWWQTTFPRGRQTLTIPDANGHPVGIAYGEKGSGPPLFLVHGVASWSYAWRHNIDALARHFRVICFDAKGSGFSEKPEHPEIPGHRVVELERIIRALCHEPAVIVAESLGALVTLAVAQAHPELVDRLVLINVPVFVKQLPNWAMQLLADVPIEVVRTVDQLRLPKLLAPIIRQAVYALRGEVTFDPDQITPEHVYWMTYPQLEFSGTVTKLAEEFQLSAAQIQRQMQGQPNLIADVQAKLATVTCPTLILWAQFDRWFPLEDGYKLCDRLPNAELKIIPNCGHYAAGGNPTFVNTAILSFLGAEPAA